MINVTIKVDETVAAWARVWAAKQGTSMSRMLGEMLREKMERDEGYERAMEAWLAFEPQPLRRPGERLPSRDSLHDR
jgi:hypothetical protein